ncbi:hypothetical protein QCN29_22780 [Streptomyces sp. HNM0663]|uniref:Uncharacterized protein n=1 Tax=Streptomyces chengmaiensis TaxID=3040919 RepID=A0ABT6HS67_9ACTN|nr:hypothetical protein [Streptomyces chengmaiensis]MDH2391552.1 hypothetical protein [Streptomyces chengmaiensis]
MTIVVTHQLENSRLADRILVMDQVLVIEQGGCAGLVNAGDPFVELSPWSRTRRTARPWRSARVDAVRPSAPGEVP